MHEAILKICILYKFLNISPLLISPKLVEKCALFAICFTTNSVFIINVMILFLE